MDRADPSQIIHKRLARDTMSPKGHNSRLNLLVHQVSMTTTALQIAGQCLNVQNVQLEKLADLELEQNLVHPSHLTVSLVSIVPKKQTKLRCTLGSSLAVEAPTLLLILCRPSLNVPIVKRVITVQKALTGCVTALLDTIVWQKQKITLKHPVMLVPIEPHQEELLKLVAQTVLQASTVLQKFLILFPARLVLSLLVVPMQLILQRALNHALHARRGTNVPTLVWQHPSSVVKDITLRLAPSPAPYAKLGTNAQEKQLVSVFTNRTAINAMDTIVRSLRRRFTKKATVKQAIIVPLTRFTNFPAQEELIATTRLPLHLLL